MSISYTINPESKEAEFTVIQAVKAVHVISNVSITVARDTVKRYLAIKDENLDVRLLDHGLLGPKDVQTCIVMAYMSN